MIIKFIRYNKTGRWQPSDPAYVRMTLVLILLSLIRLFTSSHISAQSDSLRSYLETAARNNPVLIMRLNEYLAAREKITQAGSLSDPELSMGVFLKPMELVSGVQIADFRLMQMFPWFGVNKSARDEMSMMAGARFELYRDAGLQLGFDIERTWYELYKVRKEIAISGKNLELLNTVERISLSMLSSPASVNVTTPSGRSTKATGEGNTDQESVMQGMSRSGSPSDNQPQGMQESKMNAAPGGSGLAELYMIQLEKGKLEYDISRLQTMEKTLSVQLNNYLNRTPDAVVFTPENIVPDSSGLYLESVTDSMLTNNPMLGMLNYEKQSLTARSKMVTRMGYPMVGIGMNYSVIGKNEMSASSMNGKDMLMPMVSVTLPIYRRKYRAMRSETEFLDAAATENYKATANDLQSEYYRAIQNYRDALAGIRLYENQSAIATKTLDLMIRRFSVSEAALSDVLRSQQQAMSYELEKVYAVSDFNTAVARLKRLAGTDIIRTADIKTNR